MHKNVAAIVTSLALLLLALVYCHKESPVRQWQEYAGSDTAHAPTPQQQSEFDPEQFLERRLAVLETDSTIALDNIINIRTAISGWVEQGLAESFWKQLHGGLSVTSIPLLIELGAPDLSGYYVCRAIVVTPGQTYLVRTKASRTLVLEYSAITESEYDRIMFTLCEKYGLGVIQSDLDAAGGTESHVAIVHGLCGNREVTALFSLYNRPSCQSAKVMFDYLDSLFWGRS